MIKNLELTDPNQVVEIECHVSKRLFTLTAEELVSALCLWQNTNKELEEDAVKIKAFLDDIQENGF